MATGDDEKKKEELKEQEDAFKDYLGMKKTSGNIRALVLTWFVCLLCFFIIIPLVIGMWTSGFVNLSNPYGMLLGGLITILVLAAAHIMPQKFTEQQGGGGGG